MQKYRPSRSTIFPNQAHLTRVQPARLVLLLSAFLIVSGSLALAYLLTPGNSPSPAHALARHVSSPQITDGSTPTQPLPSPQPSPSPTPVLRAPLFAGNPHFPEVALTFDDGPQLSSTPQILAILQRFGVKATFFCIGQQVQDYPALVRQEHMDGDLVEDHTWSHPNLSYLTAAAISQQLELAAQTIYQFTGIRPAFFRPPYGAINATVLAQARQVRLSTIMWNVDPRDWSLPGSTMIATRVLNTVNNGSIILLHDGGGNRAQTIAALPTIILALQARGFHFVTIQQLVDDLLHHDA